MRCLWGAGPLEEENGGETMMNQISIDTICRAVQLGVNWIDTARVYGFGHSEEVVGKALKLLPRRKMILSTKCGIQWYDDGGELHFMKEGHAVRPRPCAKGHQA